MSAWQARSVRWSWTGGSPSGCARAAAKLCELIGVLEEKQVTVERFVRVACPARGTALAAGKLDGWLSVVKLLNDLVLPFNFPLQLLIALIAEHDDPSQLPGLEAMMPGSPLGKNNIDILH